MFSKIKLNDLLMKITKKRYEIASIKKNKGYDFNLLNVLNVNYKELEICRLIYELISPKGRHGQGGIFLKLFCEKVLKENFTESEIENAKVYREFCTKDQRRIDIYIEIGKFAFPIEVKIYAGDQNNQCDDYFKSAAKAPNGKMKKMYYLTLDGHEPSEDSNKDINTNVVTISFENEIIPWLEECAKSVLDITRLRESVLQIKQSLEELCGMNNEMEKELKLLLTSSESYDNFISANELPEFLKKIKIDLLKDVFERIDQKVTNQLHLERIIDNPDKPDDNQRIVDFYNRKQAWPGLNYLYKRIDEYNQIWVRAEIWPEKNNNFCITYFNVRLNNDGKLEHQKRYLKQVQICNILHIEEKDIYLTDRGQENWILAKEETFDDDNFLEERDKYKANQMWPDFKNFNRACYNLFQKGDFFEEFTTMIANRIVFLLKR